MNNLKKQAVDNVAYWLGITKRDAQLLIDNSIEINPNPEIHFWFYRSLSLNRNLSKKKMSGFVDFGFLQEMMNDYFKKHEMIDGGWNTYENIEDHINSFIPPSLNVSTGIPSWLEGLHSISNLDILCYPCFSKKLPSDYILGSVISNYILNNQDEVLKDFNFQLQYFIKTRQYDNLTIKAISTKDIKDKDNLLNAATSPLGIQIMINRGMQYNLPILGKARNFIKTQGIVFPKNLPVLPIGFDVMLANNNVIDSVMPSSLWS